jgi:uncharacterized membrane protein SirB2
VREDENGEARVERTRPGLALQPSPSLLRAEGAALSTVPEVSRNQSNAETIADSFVKFLTGGGLGTGLALRSDSSLLRRRTAPGNFAPRTDAAAVWHMLTSSYLNLMLISLPIGIWAGITGANPTLVFSMNFLALIPLALFLGEVTEDLAVRFGDTIGGLLNATFGNVVELILSIAALSKGLYLVVATSLIGSILSNLLLVLGMCFFFGGLKHKEQRFSTLANKVSSCLLFLACIGVIIPSTAKILYGGDVITRDVLFNLSHAIAIVLIFIYLGYLLFQLRTHADFFAGEESDEVPALSLSGALACLVTITLIVAVCSGGGVVGARRGAKHQGPWLQDEAMPCSRPGSVQRPGGCGGACRLPGSCFPGSWTTLRAHVPDRRCMLPLPYAPPPQSHTSPGETRTPPPPRPSHLPHTVTATKPPAKLTRPSRPPPRRVPDGRDRGCEREQRHQPGLPGPHRAAHRGQRRGAHHRGVCGGEEQDGPGHRRRPGLLHPDRRLPHPRGGADGLGHGQGLHARL